MFLFVWKAAENRKYLVGDSDSRGEDVILGRRDEGIIDRTH
jgi:hypothetical protein